VLAGDEGRHAATVRRMRAGERIDLTDGRGTLVVGIVDVAGRDRLEIEVRSRSSLPVPTPRLVVVQALVKGERSELAVDMLTEIGVDEIVPWAAGRCVARWSGEKSAHRWSAAAEAAAKQSRRVHWPVVAPPAERADVVRRLQQAALGVVLSEAATEPLATRDRLPTSGEIVVVVGPEGGITEQELTAFAETGAEEFLLGPTVLRASTAGTVAASVLFAATGRWSLAENARPSR
jgi:16S rRNA (uracil1498-N3)-methyltransferase